MMEDFAKTVLLGMKLLDTRATMRGFLGERYGETVKPYRRSLAALTCATHLGALEVGKEMLTRFQVQGFDGVEQALLVAAIVEEIEAPTPIDEVKRVIAEEQATNTPTEPSGGNRHSRSSAQSKVSS
jgi:hypothetical protein